MSGCLGVGRLSGSGPTFVKKSFDFYKTFPVLMSFEGGFEIRERRFFFKHDS